MAVDSVLHGFVMQKLNLLDGVDVGRPKCRLVAWLKSICSLKVKRTSQI